MKKVVLLTNILTPYRVYFFDLLFKEFEKDNIIFKVLVTATTEPNRSWLYDDLKRDYTHLFKGKILELPNNIFIHINRGVKRYIINEDPDLVISAGTYLYPAMWKILGLRRKLGFKVLYWSEAHLYEERKYSKLKLAFRDKIRNLVFKRFDGFWYAGKLSLEFIEKYASTDSTKIFVPNLINNKFFHKATVFKETEKQEIKSKYNLRPSDFVLICPARITWVKGQLDFLDLFFKSDYYSKFKILFVGDGDLVPQLKELEEKHSEIQVLGYKSLDEIVSLYAVADFFLLPSLSDPNPLTCIEALWSGLPLLVSKNVGNFPEVIKNGLNGYVFDYKEPETLNDALASIVQKDKLWLKNASDKSIEIAEELYDSNKAVRRIAKENVKLL